MSCLHADIKCYPARYSSKYGCGIVLGIPRDWPASMISCRHVCLVNANCWSSVRMYTEDTFTVGSLKVKRQTSGSSGQTLMWTSAAQMMMQRPLKATPPCTRGVGAGGQRAAPVPVHSGVPEEEVQRKGRGRGLTTEGRGLASAVGCRRAGMLTMHLMKKRIWESMRRYISCLQS